MRIASGDATKQVYFVAVDATDFTTRETGLSSFTVVRSRDGAADVTYTTPTISEIDASTMPGLYALTVDEDVTLDAGDDEQEIALHITHDGMAPVTRLIELYRPKATLGNTLSVESDGDLTKVNTLDGHTPQTGDAYAVANTRLPAALTGGRMRSDAEFIGGDDAAGFVPAFGDVYTKALQMTFSPAGAISANVTEVAGDDAPATALAANIANLNATVSSRSSHSAADVWASGTRTLTSYGTLVADVAAAVWERATSALTTAGSIGKLVVDNLNATISSRLASASYTAPPTTAEITDAVLDAPSASHVEAGSVGERIERLDLLASGGAGELTAARAALLSNLDAAVSSRAAPGDEMALEDDAITDAKIAAAAIAAAALDADVLAAIKAQLTAALWTDTHPEPGVGAPPASPSLGQMAQYPYTAWRNESEQDASEQRIMADNGSTVIMRRSVAVTGDPGDETVTVGEVESGA